MSLSAAAIRLLGAKGLSIDDIAMVAEANETHVEAPQKSAAALRTQRWRDRKASQIVTGDVTVTQDQTVTGDVTERHEPSRGDVLTRVREYNPNSENNLTTAITAVSRESVSGPIDDWPEGDAHAHLRRLVIEAGSPRLDPAKSGGLITTLGRLVAWRRDGASWQHDVIPTVVVLAGKRGKPIESWKYFDGAIAQSIADNRQALTIPEAQHGQQSYGNPKQTARDDRIGRMLAGAMGAVDG